MSRKQRLILAALALIDAIVLCAMAAVIGRDLISLSSPPASIPTPTASPQPTVTPLPTWTPTLSPTPQPTRPELTSTPTGTPTGTPTPWPTFTPTPPTPTPRPLENSTFEGIQENFIPGWQTGAFVNWTTGDEFDPGSSYAAPRFHQADDPRQWIDGATLQIDTVDWVKLRAWVFQTVDVGPESRVQFKVRAMGFVKNTISGYILKAGVDPEGREGCDAAQWGDERVANQNDGVVELFSPEVVVGGAGQVTICMFAEPQYAHAYHAAFFDDAELIVLPPASP
jgi:hypothetical protein